MGSNTFWKYEYKYKICVLYKAEITHVNTWIGK